MASESAANNAVSGELNDEINSILGSLHSAPEESFQETPPPQPAPVARAEPAGRAAPTTVKVVQEALADPSDSFSLKSSGAKQRVVRQTKKSPARKEPPKLVSQRGAAVVSNISQMFHAAKTSEELLSDLLAMLVDDGPFEKSALIVVCS